MKDSENVHIKEVKVENDEFLVAFVTLATVSKATLESWSCISW